MANHSRADLEPLLNPETVVHTTPPRSYGSIGIANNNDDDDNDDDDDQEAATDQPSVQTSERSASVVDSSGGGCLSAILSRDGFHQRLLLFNVLALFVGVVTAGVIFLELERDLGQCIIGMPLYEGGLLARGVKRYWCRCPLYTVMLCSTIPWISIMVNWVSDLFSKKCAYGKWLKWQAILTCGGSVAALCAALTSALGFGNWCSRVIKTLDMEDLYSNGETDTIPPSHVNRECYSAAMMFDRRFHDEFVKLTHTFWFSLGITILQFLLIVCWAGAVYYAVRMWTRLPKDAFFAQMLLPPEFQPRSQLNKRANGQEQEQSLASAVATDQTTETVNDLESPDGMDGHLHKA